MSNPMDLQNENAALRQRVAELENQLASYTNSATEDLVRLNERYSLAVRAAALGVWDWDIQKDELVWDDPMYALYGLKKGDFSNAYQGWLNAIHPEDLASAQLESQMAVRGEKEYDTQFRVIWPDGAIHILKAYALVIRDQDGIPLRMTGVNFDISAQNIAKNNLLQSERRFSSLFENMLDGLAFCQLVSEDGHAVDFIYLSANPQFERHTGLKDVVGKRVSQVIPDIHTTNPELLEIYGRVAITGQPEEFETYVPGLSAWFSVSVYCPEKEYFVIVFENINARKHAELALQDANALYRTIFRASPDGIIITDLNGMVIDISAKILEIFGADRLEDAIGHHPIEFVAPEDRTRGLANMRSTFENSPSTSNRYTLLKKNGETFTGEIHSAVLRDASGNPSGMVAITRDISQHLQEQETLQLKDSLLNLTGEMVKVGGWEYDPDTRKSTWTDEVYRIYDLDPQLEHDINLGLSFYHGTSREKIEKALREAVELSKPYDLELELVTARGNQKWVRAKGVPVIQNGVVVKVRGIFQDLTEQKSAEQALRQSEERFRVLFNNRHSPMLLIDPATGIINDANPAACAFYGWEKNQLVGMDIADINTQPSDKVHENISQALSGKTSTQFFFKHRLANGQLRDVEVHSGPIHIGKQELLFSILYDITERTQAEEALRDDERNLQALLNAISESVLLIDSDGKVLIANQTVARRLHTSLENLLGNNLYGFLAPETAVHRQAFDRQVIHSGRPAQYEDIRFGRQIFNSVAPVFNDDGRVTRLANFGFDITEWKRAEEKIKATLEEKETLLREVHHRVKNNLQAIIALVQMQASQVQDAEMRQLLKKIEGQAFTMSLVYEQLYQSENLAHVSMAPYIQNLTANILETFNTRSDVALRLNIAAISMEVSQAMPCGLIINELFTNILKHAFPPDFSGRPVIEINLHEENAAYSLEIKDNGVGIPENLNERGNRGLGARLVNLWVTHQLGGTIEVIHKLGTAFIIHFSQPEGKKNSRESG